MREGATFSEELEASLPTNCQYEFPEAEFTECFDEIVEIFSFQELTLRFVAIGTVANTDDSRCKALGSGRTLE